MTTNETATGKLIKSLLLMSESDNFDFDSVYVNRVGHGEEQYYGTLKQFFKNHFQIYDVLRVLERVIDRQDINIDFIPLNRVDTLAEGSVENNTITFNLESIQPARISQENSRKITETSPRSRYLVVNKEDINNVDAYEVLGQQIDNIVRFRLYGRSNLETMQMSVLLRQIIQVYGSQIQNVGVPVIRFLQGGSLGMDTINAYNKRDVIFIDYLFRTEDLYTLQTPLIKAIEVVQINQL